MKKKNINKKIEDLGFEDLEEEKLEQSREQKEQLSEEDLKENAYAMTKICNGFILNNIYDERNKQYTINNLVTLTSCSIFHLLNHLPPSEVANIINYCFSIGERIYWEQEKNISRSSSNMMQDSYIGDLPKIDKRKLN